MKSGFRSVLIDCIPPILLKVLKKFLRRKPAIQNPWQSLQIPAQGPLVLPGGIKFEFRPSIADREVCRQVFINQDYDLKRLQRYDDIIEFYQQSEKPVIVDAGANIGAASLWFSLTFPKANIVAVEPDLGNFEVFSLNCSQVTNVIPLQAAIASATGSLFLTDPGGGAWAYRTTNVESPESHVVKAMTIEEIFDVSESGTPFILKIDIEGAEADLFSRHSELFDKFPLIIIELHDWMLPSEGTSTNFLRWHTEKNRDFVHINENIFSISNDFRMSNSKILHGSSNVDKIENSVHGKTPGTYKSSILD
jgi:FkbM family methyltransferase